MRRAPAVRAGRDGPGRSGVTVPEVWPRRGGRRREWLDGWEDVASRLHHWTDLDDAEQERLAALTEWLVATRHWEAARGFALTQEVVVTIAVNASLLVLDLDRRAYRDVRAVVVHPRTVVLRGPRTTAVPGVVTDAPQRVLGHAQDRRGPVVLSWEAVGRDLRRPWRGHNVVLHELAHKLDAVGGRLDGTPEIADRALREEWARVATSTYRRLRRDPPASGAALRPYAGHSPSELFAVATEAFFEHALGLEDQEPALYGALRSYYGQDTAARARRRAAREVVPQASPPGR